MTDPSAAASTEHAPRRLPAEWDPVAAIWLAWPHNLDTWPGRFQRLPKFYANWIQLMADVVPVRILAEQSIIDSASKLVGAHTNIQWVDIPTNDCWIRDYGPSFVHCDQQLHAVDWRYNAWGEKYPPWEDDDRAAHLISEHLGLPSTRTEFCLEGGAIESDGTGRLLTTASCLLAPTRNPGWDSERAAQHLHHLLGAKEIVWIDGGSLAGDDTDGHIDQLARFVDTETVVAAVCEDHNDPNRDGLQTNLRQLEIWGTTTEPKVQIHPLPIPPERRLDDVRVPESYCNFLRIGADCLLVPTFGCRQTDDHAIGLLRELAGGVETIGIDCRDLVWGLGALHCASLNQPAV